MTSSPGLGPALPASSGGISTRRQLAAGGVVAGGLPAVTVPLLGSRETVPLATPVLLVLLVVVLGSLVGGFRVGLPAAVAGALDLNWFFTVPYGTLAVHQPEQLVVLGVYLAVAVAVSVVVGVAARRTAEAARARAEATALSRLAGAALAAADTLPGLLEQVRDVFGVREVSLLERDPDGWQVVETVTTSATAADDEAELHVDAGSSLALRVRGPALFGEDRRVLVSFAEAAATALEGRRLAERAAAAAGFEAADRMRTALLSAVGHDLRTPLAGVKAAVSSLRQQDITWTPEETADLLETIEQSADRLQGLIGNLLDASRLQAGVVSTSIESVSLDELVGRALLSVPDAERVLVEVPDALPDLLVDIGLTERVLANLLDNALRHSPRGRPVTVTGTARGDYVVCDVIDHGPGVPRPQWASLFAPFQRLDDRHADGVGLGLTVAAGFTEAMAGRLEPVETVGGGLTMRLSLPAHREAT
jgi:two-component system sensor histidine kinase KdpD